MLDVCSIQRGCVYDGPGVRTTVFLHGCPLRCPWCCNPESWSENTTFFDESQCLHSQGVESPLCKSCEKSGGCRSVTECPFGAGRPTFKEMDTDAIHDMLRTDYKQFRDTGGGVTFSGGEPLLQAAAIQPLLTRLKDDGITICFETTLVAPADYLATVIDFASHLIIDLKLQPQLYLHDSSYHEKIREMILKIPDKISTTYRLVFVNGMENDVADISRVLSRWNISDIELLRAHNLGVTKYRKLGMKAGDFTADEQNFSKMAADLTSSGLNVRKLSV